MKNTEISNANANANAQFVDVKILEQTYCIACNDENKQSLLDSVDFLNEKILQIIEELGEAQYKGTSPLRIVIMATLQIVSDFLLTQNVLQQLLLQSDFKDNFAKNICQKINTVLNKNKHKTKNNGNGKNNKKNK